MMIVLCRDLFHVTHAWTMIARSQYKGGLDRVILFNQPHLALMTALK